MPVVQEKSDETNFLNAPRSRWTWGQKGNNYAALIGWRCLLSLGGGMVPHFLGSSLNILVSTSHFVATAPRPFKAHTTPTLSSTTGGSINDKKTRTTTMDVSDITPQLEKLDVDLEHLEEAIKPLLEDMGDVASKLPLLDKAKLYVLVAYAIESLLFCEIFRPSFFLDIC